MADISVNEYVRSKDGIIGKFDEIDKCVRYYGERLEDVIYRIYVGNTLDYQYLRIKKEDITKHSLNIIDLIEVGDYVNGYKVLYDYNETDKEQCNGEYRKCIIVETKSGEWEMVDWDIESIVTKEQFESMKYHVGGKEVGD